MTDETNLDRATDITLAWLASPHTRADADQAGAMLASVYRAIGRLSESPVVAPEDADRAAHTPAVDGKPYASLLRHLKSHGLTPEDYRARYNLPKTYPMVAPAYSETRSKIARTLGFGRGAARPPADTDAAEG